MKFEELLEKNIELLTKSNDIGIDVACNLGKEKVWSTLAKVSIGMTLVYKTKRIIGMKQLNDIRKEYEKLKNN